MYPVKTATDLEEITTREKKNSLIERMELDGQLTHTYPSFPRAVLISSIFLMIWFSPIVLLFLFTEYGNVFVQQSLFFSKLAVVTFVGPMPGWRIMPSRQLTFLIGLQGKKCLTDPKSKSLKSRYNQISYAVLRLKKKKMNTHPSISH